MIAKPTNKTLLITVIIILIALIGWLFNGGVKQGGRSKNQQVQPSNARPPRARNIDDQRNNRAQKAVNIDVKKRLEALYLKYPELAIPVKDPDKSLLTLYEDLFPSDDNSAIYAEIEVFETLLKKTSAWSEEEKQSAIDFLAKEQERLNVMMNLTDSSYHFQNDNGVVDFQSFLMPALRLLTTSFGLHAKLGHIAQAERAYRSTNKIIQFSQNGNLRDLIVTAITRRQLNDNLLGFSEELPQRLSLLLRDSSGDSSDFKELLRGGFANTMELMYHFSSRNDQGEIVMESAAGVPGIPLSELEEFTAASYLERIHQVQDYEQSAGGIEEIIKTLNTPSSIDLNENSKELRNLLQIDLGDYYDAIQNCNFITETQKTAIQIALAQSKGESFTGKLPLNYKTGKPIVWDEQKKLLHTGLDKKFGDYSTIKIPSIQGDS